MILLMDMLVDGHMEDGWMDRWKMDEWMDIQKMDGEMDGQTDVGWIVY